MHTEIRTLAKDTHKRCDDHVWVRSASSVGEDALITTFSIPANGSRVRLAELMEVQRQAGMVHVHQNLGVSHESVLVLQSISLSVPRPQLLLHEGSRQGSVHVRLSEAAPTSERRRSITQDFVVKTSSGIEAHGSSVAAAVPAAVYERLRRNRTTRQRPALLAQIAPMGATTRTPLLVDAADPILSDHESEHITAMALVCGIENEMSPSRGEVCLGSIAVQFETYTEINPTPNLIINTSSSPAFSGVVEQAGAITALFEGATGRAHNEHGE